MTIETVKRVLGGVPPMAVRDRYSALLRGETDEIFLRYSEIKNFEALEELTFFDGAAGVDIKIETRQ